MLAETPSPSAPTIDGKYRLDALIGEGAYGAVYRAIHLDLKKAFALKLLRSNAAEDSQSFSRFRREAEALGRLRHPAIVEVTDFGLDPKSGSPYLVMELLEGRPLSEELRQEGALPLSRALPILEAIAEAIDAAHGLGVLHRDLKPGNILLGDPARPGGSPAKVLDFGLAELARPGGQRPDPAAVSWIASKESEGQSLIEAAGFSEDARLTATGALLGTPLYIAPELIAEPRASTASDLYSFAVIAYEVLTGAPPFQGSTGEVLAAHLRREAPLPGNLGAQLPPEAWEPLRAALSKDPAGRPASARELVEGLRRAARRAAGRAWRRREAPRRLALAALLALPPLLWAVFSADPVWPLLERKAFDSRLRATPVRAPDPRIVLVTLSAPRTDSPEEALTNRGGDIARAAEAIFAVGGRGVALDLILPPWWKGSQPVQDLLLRHPERLTLAAESRASLHVVEGPEFVHPFTVEQLGRQRATELFGFINVPVDPDHAVRQGRTAFRDRAGELHPSWPARAARTQLAAGNIAEGLMPDAEGGPVSFWIDYRVDPWRYPRVPLEQVEALARLHPETFRNRLVLLGNNLDSADEDRQTVPRLRGNNGILPGLALQALQVDTLLNGRPLRPLPARLLTLAASLLAFACAALALYRPNPLAGIGVGLILAAGSIGLSFALFRHSGVLLPWTPAAALVLCGSLLPGVARRFLSRVPAP